jgi:hypothetical protein
MSAVNTIEALSQFCKQNSGDTQVWQGVSGTYHWNIGKLTRQGILNGVVRKLAGVDMTTNTKIWVVAGSFKITPEGKILRFTGLAKKHQTILEDLAAIGSEVANIVPETV